MHTFPSGCLENSSHELIGFCYQLFVFLLPGLSVGVEYLCVCLLLPRVCLCQTDPTGGVFLYLSQSDPTGGGVSMSMGCFYVYGVLLCLSQTDSTSGVFLCL